MAPKFRQGAGTLASLSRSAIHEIGTLSFDPLAKRHLEGVPSGYRYALTAIVEPVRDTMVYFKHPTCDVCAEKAGKLFAFVGVRIHGHPRPLPSRFVLPASSSTRVMPSGRSSRNAARKAEAIWASHARRALSLKMLFDRRVAHLLVLLLND